MPNFVDVHKSTPVNNTESALVETKLFPVLMKHWIYPLSAGKDPTLQIIVHDKPLTMLLGTGAHVSVLPKYFIPDTVDLVTSGHKGRLVRAFGGQEIQLLGPVCVQIQVCDLNLVHPFYYLNAETPAIVWYDLMKAAHLVLDTHSQEVWSLHPGASQLKATEGNAPAGTFLMIHSMKGTLSLNFVLRRARLLRPYLSNWILQLLPLNHSPTTKT